MPRAHNDKLLTMMAFTSAPTCPTSVLFDVADLTPDDLTPDIFLEELDLVQRFASEGLAVFREVFKEGLERKGKASGEDASVPSGDDERIPPTGSYHDAGSTDLALTAYLLPFFMRRLNKLGEQLVKLGETCRREHLGGNMTSDLTDELRRLIVMVNGGARPSTPAHQVNTLLDLTKGLAWEMPDLRQTTAISVPTSGGGRGISWKNTATEVAGDKTQEAPLKSTSAFGGRRKQRNPTGFAKFNLAELQAMDLADDDDDERDGDLSHRSEASSQRSILKMEDDSGSRSTESTRLRRQHSSIDDSKTIEIDDAETDPNWKEEKRKAAREARVRRRIPTGHPSMMKTALLARMSLDADEDDEETKTNTEANERIY